MRSTAHLGAYQTGEALARARAIRKQKQEERKAKEIADKQAWLERQGNGATQVSPQAKPYRCVCGSAFSTQNVLNIHQHYCPQAKGDAR